MYIYVLLKKKIKWETYAWMFIKFILLLNLRGYRVVIIFEKKNEIFIQMCFEFFFLYRKIFMFVDFYTLVT